ncbi:hypothetical protein RRG08_040943, partial [Elysia crispata]
FSCLPFFPVPGLTPHNQLSRAVIATVFTPLGAGYVGAIYRARHLRVSSTTDDAAPDIDSVAAHVVGELLDCGLAVGKQLNNTVRNRQNDRVRHTDRADTDRTTESDTRIVQTQTERQSQTHGSRRHRQNGRVRHTGRADTDRTTESDTRIVQTQTERQSFNILYRESILQVGFTILYRGGILQVFYRLALLSYLELSWLIAGSIDC